MYRAVVIRTQARILRHSAPPMTRHGARWRIMQTALKCGGPDIGNEIPFHIMLEPPSRNQPFGREGVVVAPDDDPGQLMIMQLPIVDGRRFQLPVEMRRAPREGTRLVSLS